MAQVQLKPEQQFKADLKMIAATVLETDGVPDSIKGLHGEVIAFLEAIVDHLATISTRVESSEAAIDQIIADEGEMISDETAAILSNANEHGQLVCQTMLALLEGPLGKAVDDTTKKRATQLVDNAMKAIGLSGQVIADLMGDDEETDEENDDDGDDGDGDDGDGDAADAEGIEEGEVDG